jgi:hypothetical protein
MVIFHSKMLVYQRVPGEPLWFHIQKLLVLLVSEVGKGTSASQLKNGP